MLELILEVQRPPAILPFDASRLTTPCAACWKPSCRSQAQPILSGALAPRGSRSQGVASQQRLRLLVDRLVSEVSVCARACRHAVGTGRRHMAIGRGLLEASSRAGSLPRSHVSPRPRRVDKFGVGLDRIRVGLDQFGVEKCASVALSQATPISRTPSSPSRRMVNLYVLAPRSRGWYGLTQAGPSRRTMPMGPEFAQSCA